MAPPPSTSPLRRLLRRAGLLLSVLFATGASFLLADGWRAFGHGATGERLARMQRSPEWAGSHFENPQPLWNDIVGVITGAFHLSDDASPKSPVGAVVVPPASLTTLPQSGLRVTWLGHSTTLVELDGVRVLTDPVWGERVSPYEWAGPKRYYPPLIALADLPPIDAVVISHDHYDHLDLPTITALNALNVRFVVPLGVGAHLEYWGVSAERITELDWWGSITIRGVNLVCTPARHASGRVLLDKDAKLWAGYALIGPSHRVYYSGDTGLFDALADIGAKYGPFDLTMIEAGQYHASWPDWHLGPEQTVRAHQLVRGTLLLPVHWGAFTLAYHSWPEPMERVLAEAARVGVLVVAPRPGQSFEPSNPPPLERWWPSLPWRTGAEDPIVSTAKGDPR